MRTVLIAVLLLPLLPASAQEAPPPEPDIDILAVSPGDLAGPDVAAIGREAQEAYQAGRYEDAARAFIRLLRVRPGQSEALYNLACCYGLLGHGPQAAQFLRAAWATGFRDLEHIRNDPDFARVRDAVDFADALGDLAEEAGAAAREAGRRLTVVAPVLADVRVIEPAGRDPWTRLPLLVGLHGYGDNADNFAALFARRGVEAPFLYCVVQAPYAFRAGEKPGFSWTAEGRGVGYPEMRRSEEHSEALVLAAIEAVKREYPVDETRVYLLGFSQGAGLAYRIGLRHPQEFRGVVPIGGWLDPQAYPPAVLEAAARMRFLLCHSPEDRMVPIEAAERARALLEAQDITHEYFPYEGGHTIPKSVLDRVIAFMDLPKAGD